MSRRKCTSEVKNSNRERERGTGTETETETETVTETETATATATETETVTLAFYRFFYSFIQSKLLIRVTGVTWVMGDHSHDMVVRCRLDITRPHSMYVNAISLTMQGTCVESHSLSLRPLIVYPTTHRQYSMQYSEIFYTMVEF